LAIIPILFISYYIRPAGALLTAFIAGIGLGLLDQEHVTLADITVPPLVDALVLSLAFCVVVLVANRLREASTANEQLRGSLVRAWHAADQDPLTGVGNRRFFTRQLDDANRELRDECAALLFCDLDGFKKINDTNGHAAGDAVLRMAASRLLHTVRAIDIVARIGGDEFAVLARDVRDADEAAHMAANIEHAFSNPFQDGEASYSVGITAGIALLPDDGTDSEELLSIADARMYRRKQEKRADAR
jgi:diguanylate cyclase (GGDEF)-like protein